MPSHTWAKDDLKCRWVVQKASWWFVLIFLDALAVLFTFWISSRRFMKPREHKNTCPLVWLKPVSSEIQHWQNYQIILYYLLKDASAFVIIWNVYRLHSKILCRRSWVHNACGKVKFSQRNITFFLFTGQLHFF